MSNPESDIDRERQPERALAPRHLYYLVSDHLLQHGDTHPRNLVSGDTADTLAFYAEVPTASFGTAVISDEELEESHVAFVGTDKASEADHRALLEDHTSILTIGFPEIPSIGPGRPHPWSRFFAARPADLRPGSQLRELYDRASGGGYRIPPERWVFFNEHDLETSPGHIPPLAELGKSILEDKQ